VVEPRVEDSEENRIQEEPRGVFLLLIFLSASSRGKEKRKRKEEPVIER